MDLFSKVYASLSNDGQREAIKRIQELTQIPAYQRFPTVDEQVEIQNAQEKISKAPTRDKRSPPNVFPSGANSSALFITDSPGSDSG